MPAHQESPPPRNSTRPAPIGSNPISSVTTASGTCPGGNFFRRIGRPAHPLHTDVQKQNGGITSGRQRPEPFTASPEAGPIVMKALVVRYEVKGRLGWRHFG